MSLKKLKIQRGTGAKMPSRAEREAAERKETAQVVSALSAELTNELRRTQPGRAAKIRSYLDQVAREDEVRRLREKWGHKAGTPETYERIEAVPFARRQGSLARMYEAETITADELAAAEEISSVVEMIERAVAIGCASLEARVDYAGSARDALIEGLNRVRMEVAYNAWRDALPVPRRLYIDMIVSSVPLVRLAARHNVHYRTARKRMISALRRWPEYKQDAVNIIDRDTLNAAYARLGEGRIQPPRPKFEQTEDDVDGEI